MLSAAQFPEQLSMFMSARDIQSSGRYAPVDKTAGESDDSFWKSKLHSAQGRFADMNDVLSDERLSDSIQQHGVHRPVSLGPNSVLGGHHRVAVEGEYHPDRLMPIVHHDVNESLHPMVKVMRARREMNAHFGGY